MSSNIAEEEEVPDIDLYDELAIKRILDEQTCKILKELGYEEEFFWSNIKLLLMTGACICGLIAQFTPQPFPESKPVLKACCFGYFAISIILQSISFIVDGDYIMFGYYHPNVDVSGTITTNRLKVKSELPRFDDMYTLTFELYGSDNAKIESSKITNSVGTYFSEKGEFDKHALRCDLEPALKNLKKKFIKYESASATTVYQYVVTVLHHQYLFNGTKLKPELTKAIRWIPKTMKNPFSSIN